MISSGLHYIHKTNTPNNVWVVPHHKYTGNHSKKKKKKWAMAQCLAPVLQSVVVVVCLIHVLLPETDTNEEGTEKVIISIQACGD
jgi:hypothetical protein